jgi:hypothetical protein
MSGRDFPKMDLNGSADPFCSVPSIYLLESKTGAFFCHILQLMLGLVMTAQVSLGERKLYTTNTIRKNRSPVWMETCRVYVAFVFCFLFFVFFSCFRLFFVFCFLFLFFVFLV